MCCLCIFTSTTWNSALPALRFEEMHGGKVSSGADGDDPPGDAVDDWALQLSVG